ncbi:sigma-54 interaction domain-containing protein [Robertmurraya korlensis]|uniref:sigma-54 interaction domain-containing protein n=1 Tax=Robertmurraya korlensis TaxID=519977 RepID=UPI0008255FA5|nr:sigma 54-interacting transcriptional regulator [Robertmurraya korlensis]
MFEENSVSIEVVTEILRGVDEGIHVVDLNGKTIFYNEVAAQHDGLTVGEVVGKPLLDVFPSLTEETSTLLRVLKSRKEIVNVAQSYYNIHGKQIETINSTIPIRIHGDFFGAMEIAKDYSSIKRLSEQLLDLQKEKQVLKSKKKNKNVKYTLEDLLTENNEFKQMKKEAYKLAKSQSSILVYGESGTGKELFVQGIHDASNRRNFPFIVQNCAAIPETLLESILFGTAKGSYTGAIDRPGLFELADGGTLFLDELHAMPIDLQAKLLRVLEDGMIRRIGSSKNVQVDVRVIAAMNVHPRKALEEKLIRTDIFYRLNVLTFELLPLRKRPEDILFLSEKFIGIFNGLLHKNIQGVSTDVINAFQTYDWPGNVRELKHTIEYMMNVCEEAILDLEHLPAMLKENTLVARSTAETYYLKDQLHQFEKDLIMKALNHTSNNIKKAAKLLGIPRQTLQYKIHKYELQGAD